MWAARETGKTLGTSLPVQQIRNPGKIMVHSSEQTKLIRRLTEFFFIFAICIRVFFLLKNEEPFFVVTVP
jgi:hypothetical protein